MKPEDNKPTILTLFGATGDLSAKQILPSLYKLFKSNHLPDMFHVFGFSHREYDTNDFRQHVKDALGRFGDLGDKKDAEEFLEHVSFVQGDFTVKDDYQALIEHSDSIEKDWGMCPNKLFYFSVSPQYYKPIAQCIHDTGISDACSEEDGWSRVLIEKPFGRDLESAKELDMLLGKLFKEVQIYRIDHYLAKEINQNILNFRFANTMFEPAWCADYIESISLRLNETIGIEDRATFFDGIGSWRDVGANHLLQLLSLLTMEQPISLSADDIRQARAELLSKISIPSKDEVVARSFRAQFYGYRGIDIVDNDSDTETYFKVALEIDDERWKGIPIYLEAGKKLGSVDKKARVEFKHPHPCLCPPGMSHINNEVTFQLGPTEEIEITFMAQKSSLEYGLVKESFEYELHEDGHHHQHIGEYEQLLVDCIRGDQTRFVSTPEVEAMWKIADPIIEAWQNNMVPLEMYEAGTDSVIEQANEKVN